jgi:hypothetical protein
MNENQVPVPAQVWIDRHTDELIYIQKQAETSQVFAALHLAELSEEYASKFDRDLVDDLETLFPKEA